MDDHGKEGFLVLMVSVSLQTRLDQIGPHRTLCLVSAGDFAMSLVYTGWFTAMNGARERIIRYMPRSSAYLSVAFVSFCSFVFNDRVQFHFFFPCEYSAFYMIRVIVTNMTMKIQENAQAHHSSPWS